MSHTTSPNFDAHDSHAAFLQELLGADRQSHAPEHGAAANAHPAVDEDTNDVVQLSGKPVPLSEVLCNSGQMQTSVILTASQQVHQQFGEVWRDTMHL